MKRQLLILIAFCLVLITAQAGNANHIHENVRETRIRSTDTLYI